MSPVSLHPDDQQQMNEEDDDDDRTEWHLRSNISERGCDNVNS